jgi:hypothetical protein
VPGYAIITPILGNHRRQRRAPTSDSNKCSTHMGYYVTQPAAPTMTAGLPAARAGSHASM